MKSRRCSRRVPNRALTGTRSQCSALIVLFYRGGLRLKDKCVELDAEGLRHETRDRPCAPRQGGQGPVRGGSIRKPLRCFSDGWTGSARALAINGRHPLFWHAQEARHLSSAERPKPDEAGRDEGRGPKSASTPTVCATRTPTNWRTRGRPLHVIQQQLGHFQPGDDRSVRARHLKQRSRLSRLCGGERGKPGG